MVDTAEGRELGWDDEIENDSGIEYVTLPAGTVAPFEVVGFSRERHTPGPGGKLPACNKAVVELRFEGFAEGQTIKENLFLHSRCEGILCAFFTSIGQRKHGEKLKPNWNALIGAKGLAKLKVDEYEKDGQKRTINRVDRYLEPSSSESPAYTPGAF